MMKYKQNLHTHSRFCDGQDSVEEMVQHAIAVGFDSIGFSGHIYKDYTGSSMAQADIPLYKQEVLRVKEKYQDKIAVWLGAEFDMFADEPKTGFDYTIGSVHCVKVDGKIVEFDLKAHIVKEIIDKYFGGDGLALAKEYYKTIAQLPQAGPFDIVGHFDLICKNCEKAFVFDDQAPAYKQAALEALHALAEKQRVFEINVGSMSRGYKSMPYPAPFLLKELKTLGCEIVITQDCHHKENLLDNFNYGAEYAKSCGFDEVLIFDGKGFTGVKL